MDFEHAKNVTHYFLRLTGAVGGALAHSDFDRMHHDLTERQKRGKLIEYVEKMAENSYLQSGDQGRELLAFVESLKVQLAQEGG